jgi:phage-related baseplate assembly protein
MMARFNLPNIDFVEVDTEELERAAVDKFEEKTGITLQEADPRRKLIQVVAYIGTLITNNIDYTAKQSRLAYAEDNYLEHIGLNKNVRKLEPIPAETITRFNVNNHENFTITAGTRMSVGDLLFETMEDQMVGSGLQYIDIQMRCTEAGTIGNGYLPGQITEIVDPQPWVSSASNVTTTAGGTDWETDDAYAERIRTANESLSTAGPELAYVYFAKSANQKIVDVKVTSPAPSEIEIIVLMQGGELPSAEVKQQVLVKCSDRSVRPLTDLVRVTDPVIFNHILTVSYYLPQTVSDQQTEYQAVVEAAVADYVLWQKSKLGRGIDPSELYARMQAAGAKRILVEPNEYVTVSNNQIAHVNVNVTFGGYIND